jgi:hypothetical protein
VEERVRAFALALPDDVAFSHVTAAQLWGLSLPRWLEDRAELDVIRASDCNRIRRVGCTGHRGLEVRGCADVRGLRVTGLADTWVDLAEVGVAPRSRRLTPDDLVVLGDEVATRLLGEPDPGERWGSPESVAAARAELGRVLAGRIRPRGKQLLAAALDRVRAPVRSPMETRARLMFARAGFPDPEVNAAVFGPDGHWILEGDLVWRRQRVIGEYQGADHASIKRRSYDTNRGALAYDEDWRVLEIYAEDVYQRHRRIACLRRFARELGLDEDGLDLS